MEVTKTTKTKKHRTARTRTVEKKKTDPVSFSKLVEAYEWARHDEDNVASIFPPAESLDLSKMMIFMLGIYAGEALAKGRWTVAERLKKQAPAGTPSAFALEL